MFVFSIPGWNKGYCHRLVKYPHFTQQHLCLWKLDRLSLCNYITTRIFPTPLLVMTHTRLPSSLAKLNWKLHLLSIPHTTGDIDMATAHLNGFYAAEELRASGPVEQFSHDLDHRDNSLVAQCTGCQPQIKGMCIVAFYVLISHNIS